MFQGKNHNVLTDSDLWLLLWTQDRQLTEDLIFAAVTDCKSAAFSGSAATRPPLVYKKRGWRSVSIFQPPPCWTHSLVPRGFFIDHMGFSIHTIMSPARTCTFISSFPTRMPCTSFSCLAQRLGRQLSTAKGEHPGLTLSVKEEAFRLSPVWRQL